MTGKIGDWGEMILQPVLVYPIHSLRTHFLHRFPMNWRFNPTMKTAWTLLALVCFIQGTCDKATAQEVLTPRQPIPTLAQAQIILIATSVFKAEEKVNPWAITFPPQPPSCGGNVIAQGNLSLDLGQEGLNRWATSVCNLFSLYNGSNDFHHQSSWARAGK